MDPTDEALSFYGQNYQLLGQWILQSGKKITLGDKVKRICRFCGGVAPKVSFKLAAHAIPELLGNKSLFSCYECDRCNQFFGKGIENDLGNWSKPMRTLQKIRGKTGVPTLKSDADGWRIECGSNGQLKISHDLIDSVFTVYEKENRANFTLRRDPHVPIGVLKAFVKIGLSLMPEAEISSFQRAIAWITNPIHKEEFELMAPVFRTFIPAAVKANFVSAVVLRRKPESKGIPYAFLVLTCGNEIFQVMLPSPEHDQPLDENKLMMPPFPHPRKEGVVPSFARLDLTGLDLIVDASVSVDVAYDERKPISQTT